LFEDEVPEKKELRSIFSPPFGYCFFILFFNFFFLFGFLKNFFSLSSQRAFGAEIERQIHPFVTLLFEDLKYDVLCAKHFCKMMSYFPQLLPRKISHKKENRNYALLLSSTASVCVKMSSNIDLISVTR
jgi:hypothetical protein